jgi:hypothetical protein
MARRAAPTLIALALFGGSAVAAAAEEPGPPPYESPMREQCTDELRKDLRWRAEISAELTDDKAFAFQQEQADKFARTERHVIYAYAAIMALTAGFALEMYRRHRKLADEIATLRADIKRASQE